ncbi:hypothetical protein ANCCAN_01884 [Ancylostoma caninum]|uniref:Variant SH3 domain protein n=1 Tax=Ancylostoma caninum TaxID=29170 RepID=A0A368H679_ANCCA|nr:hypothetical protein ANCCAN_01884 [Ancylostoma caninum]
MFSVRSAAIVAVTLWVFMLFYLSAQLFGLQGRSSYERGEVSSQLDEALRNLRELKKQNENLRELIKAERLERAEQERQAVRRKENRVSDEDPEAIKERKRVLDVEPVKADLYSLEHEVTRRLLENRIWEVYYYLHKRLLELPVTDAKVVNHTEEQILSLLATASNFSEVEGAAAWRKRSLQAITDSIQEKIHRMQNPDNCRAAKYPEFAINTDFRALICNLDKECGFGCQLHHVAYCFVTAFGSGRMLVLNRDGSAWRYSRKGWVGAFLPVTACKYDDVVGSDVPGPYSLVSQARVVQLGIVDGLANKPAFLPLSIPKPLSEQLLKLHSNPPAYFISQFIWYLMRNGEQFQEALNKQIAEIPFGKGPIVGLQVRRTDKVGTEANYHSVDEYMQWTEIWFKIQQKKQGRNVTRRIFVATDDPTVVPEIKQKYTNYEVYGDVKTANTAQLESRYTDSSLFGVVRDIRLLSLCDYLVCTFSSQVCRMGFELMQVQQGDAGERFHSLDDLYYYGGQHAHELVAVEDHIPEHPGEIELRVGDIIGIAGNHWDGYSKGMNKRSGATGLYPSYKAIEKWRIVDFPPLS